MDFLLMVGGVESVSPTFWFQWVPGLRAGGQHAGNVFQPGGGFSVRKTPPGHGLDLRRSPSRKNRRSSTSSKARRWLWGCLDGFPSLLHFLTFQIQSAPRSSGTAWEAKACLQTAGRRGTWRRAGSRPGKELAVLLGCSITHETHADLGSEAGAVPGSHSVSLGGQGT